MTFSTLSAVCLASLALPLCLAAQTNAPVPPPVPLDASTPPEWEGIVNIDVSVLMPDFREPNLTAEDEEGLTLATPRDR